MLSIARLLVALSLAIMSPGPSAGSEERPCRLLPLPAQRGGTGPRQAYLVSAA
jgi:hypothetical protein